MTAEARAVLCALADVARLPAPAKLPERLAAAGWTEAEFGSAGLQRWTFGEIETTYHGGGTAIIETTVDLVEPDTDDEDFLYEEFAIRFARMLASAEELLGPTDFRGMYGDDGFPDEEAEAVEAARWHLGAGSAGLNLMHEDQGVPFRLTVTAT
ncbi:hypothetical protein J2S43_002793 [Catenuloplanes nepalensis]|uniref:Uncharacterized protein n=1 Tax=Catenuloplanes nepalensis TaxID=587533 RepID=A0ABT9MSM9_9ACTN|nr:hypothetical protein [Catenuloplanes nepalensis]MDP9794281.1 hypothetical protein [Catenuloplanes nepalensis]